ncbi:MAG: rod shape-determining protein MreC [Syntrophobacterales bacterium]|nr:MAG: rod shape-determining protein MreC [Syntrophobacterales bacterium]
MDISAQEGDEMASPKRSYAVIIALALVVVFLIVFYSHFKSPEKMGFFRKIVLEAVVPLEGAINAAVSSIGRGWEKYILLVGREQEIKRLEETIAPLTRELNDCREASLECVRLRKLMEMKDTITFPTVAARVVGRNRLTVFRTVLIDKGTVDGVEIGFPVVAAHGVAGRIIEVSWNVSKMLLLVDYNSNIDALVQRNRCQGVLRGRDRAGCELKYVQHSEEIMVGDVVISSGLAGVFPKGLLLGTVAEVDKTELDLFQRITVRPSVDVTRLEEVLIIVKKGEGR